MNILGFFAISHAILYFVIGLYSLFLYYVFLQLKGKEDEDIELESTIY